MNTLTIQEEPDEEPRRLKRKTFAHLGGLFCIICLIGLGLFMLMRPNRAQVSTPPSVSSHTHYKHILGETHTGLRLARLTDFLEHTPDNAYIPSVRIQHSVLQMHEERAWAKLSEIVYSLDTNIEDKILAKDEYIENWGTLLRTDKLNNLPLSAPQQIIAPASVLPLETLKTASLAGAPKAHKRQIKAKESRTIPPSMRGTIKARIRKARAPVYPSRAHRRGIDALIVLSLTINEKGRVVRTHTLEVETERYRSDFIRAAKRAARRTRFHPKTIDGRAVKTQAFIRRYRFSAKD